MNKKLAVLLALLALVAFGAGAQDGEPIKIGAIFDLTGETSDVGGPYADGVAAYFQTINESGGIDGRMIELLSADARYDARTAEQIYNQLAGEGVVAVLGWGTEESVALASRAASDRIPYLSASSSEQLNDPNGNAPFNFLVTPTYGDQLSAMIFHMLELWQADGYAAGDMRVAVFYHDSAFGRDPLAAGEDFARSAQIAGVLAMPMSNRANSFTAELQQADDYGVTHIIIQNLPGPAARLAQNIVDFYGGIIPGRVGCLNWCANEQFVRFAGAAAENVLGAQPFTPTSVEVPGQDEPAEYLDALGLELSDASLHFTQGWATASILGEAIAALSDNGLEINGANVRAALESMRDLETGALMEAVTFTPDDHRATRALTVYVVENGEWTPSSNVLDLR